MPSTWHHSGPNHSYPSSLHHWQMLTYFDTEGLTLKSYFIWLYFCLLLRLTEKLEIWIISRVPRGAKGEYSLVLSLLHLTRYFFQFRVRTMETKHWPGWSNFLFLFSFFYMALPRGGNNWSFFKCLNHFLSSNPQ